jgi:hypothetical protein
MKHCAGNTEGPEEVAVMAAVVTNLLYFAISVALVAVVGQALSRSGRAVLAEAMAGDDTAARAVSRLLVIAFYLLSLGFVALTAPSWSHVAGPAQGAALLSGRIGLLLLVLGVMHVTSTLILARLRRGRAWAPWRPAAGTGPDLPDSGGAAERGPVAPAAPWRPRGAVH